MPVSVGWKWKVDAYRHKIGCSTSKSSRLEAFDERRQALPLKSSMKTCVFTPAHETGILVAHIIPYAGSHDTRLGRESAWPLVPSGSHVFSGRCGSRDFFAPGPVERRFCFVGIRGSMEIIVHVIQGQLLPQPVFVLAERADPAPDRGDMLADAEVEPLYKGRVDVPAQGGEHLIDGLQGAKHHAVLYV